MLLLQDSAFFYEAEPLYKGLPGGKPGQEKKGGFYRSICVGAGLCACPLIGIYPHILMLKDNEQKPTGIVEPGTCERLQN